jgi:hypothetical protein
MVSLNEYRDMRDGLPPERTISFGFLDAIVTKAESGEKVDMDVFALTCLDAIQSLETRVLALEG